MYSYKEPLKTLFPDFERVFLPGVPTKDDCEKLKTPGLLVIWGGSDIHPSIYGRENMGSYVLNSPSLRDQVEMKLCAQAIKREIPILGVCRGAQLLCALAGGILVQDVSGHEYGHRVSTTDTPDMMSSSLHHQMMYPWKTEHKLLAWGTMPRSTHYTGLSEAEQAAWPTREYESATSETTKGVIEPEVVWFPTIKGLAVQGHPEHMDPKGPFNLYLKKLLNAYCFHA